MGFAPMLVRYLVLFTVTLFLITYGYFLTSFHIIVASLFAAATMCMLILGHLGAWFACVAMLVYLGGLMVVFAYFLATQPNQWLEAPIRARRACGLFVVGLLCAWPGTFRTHEMVGEGPVTLTIIFQDPYFLILLFRYLIVAMFSVVTTAKKEYGALRATKDYPDEDEEEDDEGRFLDMRLR